MDQTDVDGLHVNIWVRDLISDAVTRIGFGPWLEQVSVSKQARQTLCFSHTHGKYGTVVGRPELVFGDGEISGPISSGKTGFGCSFFNIDIILVIGRCRYVGLTAHQYDPRMK